MICIRLAVLRNRRQLPLGGSNPTHEKQYDKDDQDDTDDADAAVTVAVAVAAEATTEATKQEDDKYDDKYQPDRHDLSPVASLNLALKSHARILPFPPE